MFECETDVPFNMVANTNCAIRRNPLNRFKSGVAFKLGTRLVGNYTHNLHMDNYGQIDLFTQRTGTMEVMWEMEGVMETVAVGWKFAHLIANVTVKMACVIVVE